MNYKKPMRREFIMEERMSFRTGLMIVLAALICLFLIRFALA